MNFRLLQIRLLAHIRSRVRNGEISERRLARITGVSQPHLHNVLKGVRLLSTDTADKILQHLRIDLADLLTAAEPPGGHHEAASRDGDCRAVPLLEGRIGPGCPYPEAVGRSRYPFRAADVGRLHSPVAASLAPDPRRPPPLCAAGVVLLDASKRPRLDPNEEAYFALDLSSESTIGRVRRAEWGWLLWNHESGMWLPIAQSDRDPLDLIKGRVSLLMRHL
jgi:transcriptional regulator with XRE-family HTH domain